jgi:hypothetical protein
MSEQEQTPAIEQQATEQVVNYELGKMLSEVKRKLKPESKNELIRIISALLLDNYALKMQIVALQPKPVEAQDVKV